MSVLPKIGSLYIPLIKGDSGEGTQFNLMMGLCVGHDALFLKHCQALTAVFAVKDRLLGHNPLAALYLSRSYYRRLRSPNITALE